MTKLDPRRRRRYARRTAIGLLVAGGCTTALGTSGFTNLSAGRGVSISTETDDQAALTIVDNATGEPIEGNTYNEVLDVRFDTTAESTIDITGAVTGDTGLISLSKAVDNGTYTFTVDGTEFSIADLVKGESDPPVLEIANTEGPGGADAEISLDVTADIDGVSLELTRGVTVAAPSG